MSGHTPGPWTVERHSGAYHVHYGEEGNGAECCAVHYASGVHADRERAEADAALIASAPELLAALRAMLAAVESEHGADFLPFSASFPGFEEANAAVLAARSAIARAEGRQP